jgi:predicted transcriptional regulator
VLNPVNKTGQTKMTASDEQSELIALTADIVSAYVSNNTIPAGDLPGLVRDVYGAMTRLDSAPAPIAQEPSKPAVSPKKSITAEYLICLEDGKKFKSLKRHLRTMYNLSPEQYREKWNLPADYPMVAPNYAEARSRLAKEMGLGQKRKRAVRR